MEGITKNLLEILNAQLVASVMYIIDFKTKFWIQKGVGIDHCYKKVRKQGTVASYSEMT